MEFREMLDKFCHAVAVEDAAGLAALFTDDGVYHDLIYGEINGPAAIEKMLVENWYSDGVDYRWDMLDPVCDGETGYARYDASFKSKLKHSAGKRVAAKGVATFKLAPDGRIKSYSEVANGAAMLHQLNVRGPLLEKMIKRWDDEQSECPNIQKHLAG